LHPALSTDIITVDGQECEHEGGRDSKKGEKKTKIRSARHNGLVTMTSLISGMCTPVESESLTWGDGRAGESAGKGGRGRGHDRTFRNRLKRPQG